MSTSPLPPDPYEALGVGRDCDVDAVKKAHRKLVLKHHPDRIKDPALVEHNQNEFTKVQQAYELLVDPARRKRYDDECRLAQLRRERMSDPRPTYTRTTYTAPRPSPAPTNPVQREFKADPRYAYEERVPDSPYESMPRGFEDSFPRNAPRKVDTKTDPTEKRPSVSKPSERKEKPRGAWERDKAQPPMSMRAVFGVAAMASNMAQTQKAKTKEREKEMHAKNAKARDQEERRAREMKQTYTKPSSAYVEDESEDDDSSGTESDTIVTQGRSRMRGPSPAARARHLTPEPPRSRRQPSPASEVRPSRQQSPRPVQKSARRLSPGAGPKPTRQPSPRPEARSARQPSPRPEARHFAQSSPRADQRSAYDDDSADDDKHNHFYRSAQDYITTAQRKDPRPPLSRQGSGVHEQYWQNDAGRDRKSGSDSDKQHPTSAQKPSRRSMPDESKLRPALFPQSSAPAGVRSMGTTETRDPFASTRSRGNSYVSSPINHRREMPPELKRSPSEPVPQKVQAKRDSVPLKGSSLKQTESMLHHDSGYGSSSNPQTPENRGESPPRDSRPREASSTTKYSVRRDEEGPRARKMGAEDGVPMSRYLSPQDQPHHHRHHHHNTESRERHASRSRERESEGRHRSSSNRPAHPERQSSFNRNDSNSRHDERDRSRNVRMEASPERHSRGGGGGGGGGGGDDGYFVRQWSGNVRESRPKPAMYQGPATPNFSKHYEQPPRGVQQQRRPSLYA